LRIGCKSSDLLTAKAVLSYFGARLSLFRNLENSEIKTCSFYMRFDIITIFPKIFDSYLKETFIKKAREKGLIKIRIHNLRDFTTDKHKTVDDRPYGGGLGMVIKIEPIYRAVQSLKLKIKNEKLKITKPDRKSVV
jgi:hypothetical protein